MAPVPFFSKVLETKFAAEREAMARTRDQETADLVEIHEEKLKLMRQEHEVVVDELRRNCDEVIRPSSWMHLQLHKKEKRLCWFNCDINHLVAIVRHGVLDFFLSNLIRTSHNGTSELLKIPQVLTEPTNRSTFLALELKTGLTFPLSAIAIGLDQ